MRPTSSDLVSRDPALAALVGAIGSKGSNFGADLGRGYEFGADYSFGEDAPTPDNMQKAWMSQQATKARERLLEPNRGSDVKVQRYAFGVAQSITLATPVAIDVTGQPDTNFRPQRITSNAPLPGFVSLTSIKVANVAIIVGGTLDAFEFCADGTDQSLDVPTLSPANRIRVQGQYSGLLPSGGYLTATAYLFVTSFKGPATMAG